MPFVCNFRTFSMKLCRLEYLSFNKFLGHQMELLEFIFLSSYVVSDYKLRSRGSDVLLAFPMINVRGRPLHSSPYINNARTWRRPSDSRKFRRVVRPENQRNSPSRRVRNCLICGYRFVYKFVYKFVLPNRSFLLYLITTQL